jgi:hypothetical protein
MEEGHTHGGPADYIAARSEWTTTKVAAQALGIDPRTVRKYIKQGKLVAKTEGQGVEKTYLVSIDSVYAMRDSRADPGAGREKSPRESAGSALSEDLVALVRELASEARHSSSEAAELRTRLELTERAESSLREALEQKLETEQLRREQAERERDELAARLAELEPTSQPRESGVSASDEQGGPDVPPEDEEQEKPVSWWRRMFGG